MGKKKLGKGIDALFSDFNFNEYYGQGDNEMFHEEQTVKMLRLSLIEPNRNQPRKQFDNSAISELAASIKQYGLLQPILVRPYGNVYQIVAGERRWRAAREAGLEEIPVQIRELDDQTTAQIALIENLQRVELSPIEIAQGYKELIQIYGLTQEQVAQRMNVSRSQVANMLRLLVLDEETKQSLEEKKITIGHAKVLAGVAMEEDRQELLHKCLEDNMTVRELEEYKDRSIAEREYDAEIEARMNYHPKKDPYLMEVEKAFYLEYNCRAIAKRRGKGACIILNFKDSDHLVSFMDSISKK